MAEAGKMSAVTESEIPDPEKDEMRVLLFTSGTTGSSKAVCLSQNNICVNIHSTLRIVHVDSTGDSTIIPTIDRARGPMVEIPSSNAFPAPRRFPKMRSTAPKTANRAMIQMITRSKLMPMPPEKIYLNSTIFLPESKSCIFCRIVLFW